MEKENALENHGLFKMDESGVVVKDLEALKGLNKMIATTDGRMSYFEKYDNVISYS